MNSERFLERPLADRLQLSSKEKAKFPDCSPIVVTPKRDLATHFSEKKYSIQSHIRVMDLIRILQDNFQVGNQDTCLALFAQQSSGRVLLRSDEFISEAHRRLSEHDGWLYLYVDTQKRFG